MAKIKKFSFSSSGTIDTSVISTSMNDFHKKSLRDDFRGKRFKFK